MKPLRTLPLTTVAVLVICGSAVGGNPRHIWWGGLWLTAVAAAISVFGYAHISAPLKVTSIFEMPHLRRKQRAIIGLSLALIFSTMALHWPLRICFWLSRPALERVAQQAKQRSAETPQNAGLFTIQHTDFTKDESVLTLGDDSGEMTFLVRKKSAFHKDLRHRGDKVDLDGEWCFYSISEI